MYQAEVTPGVAFQARLLCEGIRHAVNSVSGADRDVLGQLLVNWAVIAHAAACGVSIEEVFESVRLAKSRLDGEGGGE